MVGAPSPYEPGLYYQWGALVGNTATGGYSFNEDTYREQGLDTINNNLTNEWDAARAYYGPSAKMPSMYQLNELSKYCSVTMVSQNVYKFTSKRNGENILVYGGGAIEDTNLVSDTKIRVWSTEYNDQSTACGWHGEDQIYFIRRILGLNIMAVHS